MSSEYIEKIDRAKVYEVAVVSPLDRAYCLSQRLGNRVLLKREDMQPVFSFKLRGAYNKIANLPQARERGVITASAGNHAQGVALACKKLGIRGVIVMPSTTPPIKVAAVRRYDAEVVLHGDTYDQAFEHATELTRTAGMIFVPPYDDPDVIAGQGTIGKEIHEQYYGQIDAVFVPVGGGGLIAGIGVYLKHLRPQTRVIGVEPEDAPTLHAALAQDKRVVLDQVGLFADGVAVQQIGEENFRLAREVVDQVVLVTTDEICAAIKDNFDDTRALAEPAGALALAGLKKHVATHGIKNRTLVAVISGANINFDRLKHVVERYEIGENTESLLAVSIPERPGSFLEFCRIIGKRTITEFNYRYAATDQAQVFVGVHFNDALKEKSRVTAKLEEAGYKALDISDNEMAKLHLRHMVGGHAHNLENERLYRFQFPERPGALLQFLEKVRQNWNISLFHYRNHGAAYGRVLIGIQVPAEQLSAFHASLDELGYPYQDESGNPAYALFLR